jgi:hypothetical protein
MADVGQAAHIFASLMLRFYWSVILDAYVLLMPTTSHQNVPERFGEKRVYKSINATGANSAALR